MIRLKFEERETGRDGAKGPRCRDRACRVPSVVIGTEATDLVMQLPLPPTPGGRSHTPRA